MKRKFTAKSIQLTISQADMLRRLSNVSGKSQNQLIRDAIDQLFRGPK